MKPVRMGLLLCLAALVAACGGGGGSSSNNSGGSNPPPISTCSLRDRQNWAAAQIREWYFFPETLPASLDPAPYPSVDAYIDALTASARAQGRDRFFTYITSIAEENAFINSGQSAGFGIRLAIASGTRLFVAEAFEGAPGLAAGIDRGTEILAIGTSSANLRTVSSILASEGSGGITNALGPNTAGTTRVLRITDAGGTREVTVAKADFELLPVSTRYGAQIINDGGRQVGYVNLRTFIGTADPALRNAFAQFRAAGITEIIVDFRYNGGGLVRIADLMGDLLGGNRTASDVFSYTVFRPEKSSLDETRRFQVQPQSVSPTRIAFIGTGGTASASELVINAFIPYLGSSTALVGTNTFGKPVGQVAIDRAACDDRLRVVAFATQNAARQGAYYNGLAGVMPATCQAGDDISRPLGDPQEASVARALDFLAGRSCNPITSGIAAQTLRAPDERRELLTPERPSAAQRDVPGLF
ncbi:MAG: peptidase S41 [Sphingomonas sp.]|nr:peptidase S41 [Sphingomonas sp.]